MAAVNILDTFEPQVAPLLRRVPRALMEQKAREILREFLQFTRLWNYLPAAQNIVATQATYVLLTPGAYAEIIAASWVRVSNPAGSGGDPARRREVEWLDRMIPSWRVATGDDFRYFAQELPTSIIFPAKPVTAVVGGLEYRVSLKPTMAATQVDDTITNEFLEELAEGVRWKLYGMHGEPWANEKAADDARRAYMAGRGRARIKAQKRFGDPGDATQSWVSPYKFA